MAQNEPNFEMKIEGIATSTFSPKTSLDELSTWLRTQKWRGTLQISYAGNGGVSSVSFTERVSMNDPAALEKFHPPS